MNEEPIDDIEVLEGQLPAASGVAFSKARESALAAGRSVLQAENGVIFEVYPNGSRKFVKFIGPPVEVDPTQKIELQ